MINKYVHAIGVELEGGWTRMQSYKAGCDHIHTIENGCLTFHCYHVCSVDSYCYEHEPYQSLDNCYGCKGLSGRERKAWAPALNCLQTRCNHTHEEACYQKNCKHVSHINCKKTDGLIGYRQDGSVRGISCNFTGEVASPICYEWDVFEKWIQDNRPDKVNHTCGTHFHISLNTDEQYKLLTSADFYQHFMKYLLRWVNENKLYNYRPLIDRIEGYNSFCCPNGTKSCRHGTDYHDPKKQMATNSKDSYRYSHINYCKTLHGTIEFRVFHGMVTPSRIMAAAKCVTDAVESYLDAASNGSVLNPKSKKKRVEFAIESPAPASLLAVPWNEVIWRTPRAHLFPELRLRAESAMRLRAESAMMVNVSRSARAHEAMQRAMQEARNSDPIDDDEEDNDD